MDDGSTVTTNLYVVPELEIENPAAGPQSGETVHWYLHPNIRHEITRTTTEIHPMHWDQLNSLVIMTDNSADWGIKRVYASVGWNAPYSNSVAVDPLPESIEYRAPARAAM